MFDSVQKEMEKFSENDISVLARLNQNRNSPILVRMPDGKKAVIKSGGAEPKHIRTEILANCLYRELGVPVIPTSVIQIDNSIVQYQPYICGLQKVTWNELVFAKDFLFHVGVDFFLANWDLTKTSNFVKFGSQIYRLDNGGALDYRARGTHKGTNWSCTVNEVYSMTTKVAFPQNPYSLLRHHHIFYSISCLISRFREENLTAAFQRSHYPVSLRLGMKEMLLCRLQNLERWLNSNRIAYR